MLDPTTLPILLKSLDFIYEEYSKLLEERRERRKDAREGSQKGMPELPAPTKEEALEKKIEPKEWQASEAHIEHLTDLLDIHYDNYHLLSKQYAQWTEVLVPPVISNGLMREEKEIEKITMQLKEALANLYSKDA